MPSAACRQNVFWLSEGSTTPDTPESRSQVDESTQGTQSHSQEDAGGSVDVPKGGNLKDVNDEVDVPVCLLITPEN